jgi:hypothetical protein
MRKRLPIFIVYISVLCACSDKSSFIDLGTASSCDAAVMACSIHHEKYSLTLLLGPHVKPLQPFHTKLKLKGADNMPKDVIVDFRMIGMDMGLNRYRLNRNVDVWEGKTILPVCTASRADWMAVVEFTDDGQKYSANFPFHTDMN